MSAHFQSTKKVFLCIKHKKSLKAASGFWCANDIYEWHFSIFLMHMVRLDSLENTYHFDPFIKFLHKKDMPKFSQFCIYFSMHNIEHRVTSLEQLSLAEFSSE